MKKKVKKVNEKFFHRDGGGDMKKFMFLCLLINTLRIFAEDADLLYLSAGIFDLRKERYRTAEFRLDYKSHLQYWFFRPTLGLMMSAKKSFYACGGFSLDFVICKHMILAPHFSAGYYAQGNGKNLGFPLEFRSGIEFGYRSNGGWRTGIDFTHMSNAHLGHRNPGVESLVFFVGIPLNKPSS